MATPHVTPHVFPQQVHSVPTSFGEAVIHGWKLVRETTVLEADKRRHGTVILAKSGSPDLEVQYTATIQQGYKFTKPQLA